MISILEHIKRYQHFYRDRYRDPNFVMCLSELLYSLLENVIEDTTYASFLAYGKIGFIGQWIKRFDL